MPSYHYKAREITSGRVVRGTLEAATRVELSDRLRGMGYITTSVTEASAVAQGMRLDALIEKLRPIGMNDLLMFFIQLSSMINAGITILMSLTTLKEQVENKKLRDVIGSVAAEVEGGKNLSQAFADYPQIFSRLFVNMIKAGEASGKLDVVLTRYAAFFESQEDIKENVKGALFYPVILLVVAVAVMLFIVTFVIPQFAKIYVDAHIALPLPTLIVFKAGTLIKGYWYYVVMAAAAAFVGIRFYLKTEQGRRLFDIFKLRVPIVGPLYRQIVVSRFVRTLATLVGSGVPILEALDITRDVVGNVILADVIGNVRNSVREGERIAAQMKVSKEFPPYVTQMIAVGEDTGSLDVMLNKAADFYDTVVKYTVKRLTTVIEPVFLIIVGAMVGFIMASMLMPVFDMVKTLRRG